MKCPKCKTETLAAFKVEEVAVDRCSSCDGIWFDAQELRELLAEDAQKVASLRRGGTHEELDGKKAPVRATAANCCASIARSSGR